MKRDTRCFYCGIEFDDAILKRCFTVDHVIPRKLGGAKLPNNKVGACFSCNSMKGGGTIEELRRKKAQVPRFDQKQLQWLRFIGIPIDDITAELQQAYVFHFEREGFTL